MTLTTAQFRGSGVRNAKALYASGGAVTSQLMKFVRSITPDPKINTQTYEGDDVAEDVDSLVGFTATIELDKFDIAIVSRIFTKHMVTGIAGEDWRLYFGDNTEVGGGVGGFQYDVVMRDEATGTTETLRYTFPKGSWQMFRPNPAAYNTKHGITLRFTAEKTLVDVAGNALTSVPSDGTFYYLAQVA